jgi:hypothetical protein
VSLSPSPTPSPLSTNSATASATTSPPGSLTPTASLSLGSYPFFTEGLYGSNLVLRSRDEAELTVTVGELIAALRAAGIENVREVEPA